MNDSSESHHKINDDLTQEQTCNHIHRSADGRFSPGP